MTPCTISWIIAGVMLLDLLVLTAMLYVTGGATNPFVVFYFVNLALVGVLLEPPLAWGLTGVAVGCVSLLFWTHWPLEVLRDPERLLPLRGAVSSKAAVGHWIALVTCAGVIVAFMTRVTMQLRASEQARRRAEELRSRSEKLEALGTLAAGAAHELATPLSTIAVVATEVERELSARALPPEIAADLQLIRRELQRCRSILDRMAIDSGSWIAEPRVVCTLRELLHQVVAELPATSRIEFAGEEAAWLGRVEIPQVVLAQALRGLVQNGVDATAAGPVILRAAMLGVAAERPRGVRLQIVDHGPGMANEVLSRVGEPFYTTKEPGKGMGLGVFLARSVVERIGGTLRIESKLSAGTEAVVDLPTVV